MYACLYEGKVLLNKKIDSVAIIGVGLLGGSVGLALRSGGFTGRITGIGRRKSTLDKALESQAIDLASLDPQEGVRDAGLIILATPIGMFEQMLQSISQNLRPGCLVTDVGSTKRLVVNLAGKLLPKNTHFVGAHPIAGSEKRGPEYARADLYDGALCILTPTAATDADALDTVTTFWQTLGMRVRTMTPAAHDRLLAQVSHLPHMMAAALVNSVPQKALTSAGTGFLDTTRIASGDPQLWHDIGSSNADYLAKELERMETHLARLRQAIQNNDSKAIRRILQQAKEKRDWLVRYKVEHKELPS